MANEFATGEPIAVKGEVIERNDCRRGIMCIFEPRFSAGIGDARDALEAKVSFRRRAMADAANFASVGVGRNCIAPR
jgi:hypothetical protein